MSIAINDGRNCLANTVRDIAASRLGDRFIRKTVLLLDGMSALGGFGDSTDQFVAEMANSGIKTTTTMNYLG